MQKTKRESMLATEAATNKLKQHKEEFKEGNQTPTSNKDHLSHGDRYDFDPDTQLVSEESQVIMEHQLRALMHVLKHNLKMVGTPLPMGNVSEQAVDSCEYLADHMISYIDPLGNAFLMPCKDPTHKVIGTNVYGNEPKHHILSKHSTVRLDESEVIDDDHEYLDLLVESRRI